MRCSMTREAASPASFHPSKARIITGSCSSGRSSISITLPSLRRVTSDPVDLVHSLPAAVLWDMDGTLVDTEPYWITAEHELVESFGGRWTQELALSLVGNPLLVSAQFILDNS